ncbi:MAG: arylsulfatase [Gemmataceae bacterium]
MTSRCHLLVVAIAIAACGLLPRPCRAAPPARPNIIYLLADDLGWTDVGWHQSEIKTPHLDKLAAGGAKLEQFYVQPVCSPTRAALMTGRYPMRHGLQVGVVRPFAQYGLPLEERTLPQALKEAGYDTAICGKWHLGHFQPEYLPTRRGFVHQYGHYNGALDYFTHMRDGGFDWHKDDKVCRDPGYTTTLIGGAAARIIEDHDTSKPLFLYVPFNAPHSPLQALPEHLKQYEGIADEKRRTYAAMVACIDDQVGHIVAALAKRKMTENTLIVFSSDNGGPTSLGATNGKLRAGKGTLYEGGVRVAAFANWPGQIRAGSVIDQPLHVVDCYPTFLKLAGAKLEQKQPLDGKDMWATLTEGKPSPHEFLLLNTTPGAGALRVGDWKLVINGRNGAGGGEEAKKMVELFNLAKDPYEQTNLAAERADKVKELQGRYDELARQALPPKSKPKAKDFQVPKIWGEKD